MKYLLVKVGCAECWDGESSLVEVVGLFSSTAEATASVTTKNSWETRPGGGLMSITHTGGYEILPLQGLEYPPPYPTTWQSI